jgi:hypothetical protein
MKRTPQWYTSQVTKLQMLPPYPGTSTASPEVGVWPDDVDSDVWFNWVIPLDYVSGTSFAFHLLVNSPGTGTAKFTRVYTRYRVNTANLAVLVATPFTINVSSTFTSFQFTEFVAGTSLAPRDTLLIQIKRFAGTDAADTLESSLILSGAWIEYTAVAGGS